MSHFMFLRMNLISKRKKVLRRQLVTFTLMESMSTAEPKLKR